MDRILNQMLAEPSPALGRPTKHTVSLIAIIIAQALMLDFLAHPNWKGPAFT
ncbi:MAG: hypothetical protein UY48_C0008G0023 [Candidatus Gottesmanbacteria bacterium GW2011_GWB1_49_7]|uniref:Uncharacterized protein n=1 Tax=Candidatus Gottesmanbacteria bacterium GW2011_GWB1_49_7 TaxID=1618448 RepID=A0A0G1W2A9_9BACT|nr:MAG: hypothetical protein UY48_C0008G0023 [Candidatus Gottesmanbacteria bacterium GW2011_GWB1_49_7]